MHLFLQAIQGVIHTMFFNFAEKRFLAIPVLNLFLCRANENK